MTARTPMTQDGYNKIKADVERMENVEMPIIAQKIADARAEGDLKENAEYHGQREAQGMLQAKINQLKSKLSSATIIENRPGDQSCCFGLAEAGYGHQLVDTHLGHLDQPTGSA